MGKRVVQGLRQSLIAEAGLWRGIRLLNLMVEEDEVQGVTSSLTWS